MAKMLLLLLLILGHTLIFISNNKNHKIRKLLSISKFITKLKLTGKNVIGSIVLPDATLQDIENFLQINMKVFTKKQKEIINKLALECKNNGKIKIQISGNSII